MVEPSDNSALIELLAGISDRKIRRKVKKLVDYGAEAVRSLGELDSALYSRENGEDQLQIISDAVLSHVRRLLEYLGMIASTGTSEDADPEADVEFASGDSLDLTVAAAAVLKKVEGGASGDAEPGGVRTDEDKWRELAAEMDSMQYGLGSELRDLDGRFAEALKDDRKGQALHDLSDATSSLTDGVFAMITTVYQLFLGRADPDRMIPGYRDTLGKALVVRRSVTELRREVQELNRSIQDLQSESMVVEMSYKLLLESLVSFTNASAFSILRPGDRQEFSDFAERLLAGDATRSRMDCEGLDKYLDSLAVVSQRDVLIKHDLDLREQVFAELDGALSLADVLPQSLPQIINHCFARTEELFGLMEALDSLVYQWSTLSEEKRNDSQEARKMGHLLKDLVEPPRKTPPPDDGGFF